LSRGNKINCNYCGKPELSKDIIGLNKKLIHRQIKQMMCLRCMADYFETTEEELEILIERFKLQGCSLFG